MEQPLRAFRLSAALCGVAASFIVCATVACHQPTAAERILGARARTPVPASDGACHFDLQPDKAETVFFVLGFLEEYLGRNIVEESDHVEAFYCNEKPAAELFRKYLVKLAQEQGIDPAVRDEVIQKCLVRYHSKPIADRLNSCYRYQASNEGGIQVTDGTYRRTASASLESRLFMRDGHGTVTAEGLSDDVFYRRRALAYVSGAWVRYGRGSDFVFANAHDKAALIAELLRDLGCTGIRIESTVGFIPQTNTIHFQPTSEVTEWLHRAW